MLELICLRHWPTDWNLERRLQGRRDRPLTEDARRELAGIKISPSLQRLHWYCSPLRRARETAAILGLSVTIEAALTEMDWGLWEGQRIADLRRADPTGMAAREDRGLDLRPPGGESPRQVQQRLEHWAEQLRRSGQARVGAVCHKGLIRALMAAACNWDMRGRAPVKLDYSKLQCFRWDGRRWHPGAVNVPLDQI